MLSEEIVLLFAVLSVFSVKVSLNARNSRGTSLRHASTHFNSWLYSETERSRFFFERLQSCRDAQNCVFKSGAILDRTISISDADKETSSQNVPDSSVSRSFMFWVFKAIFRDSHSFNSISLRSRFLNRLSRSGPRANGSNPAHLSRSSFFNSSISV